MQRLNVKHNIVAMCASMLSVALVTSCQSNSARVEGRFIGGDSSVAYLEEVTPLDGVIIDSAVLSKSGEFVFNLKSVDKQQKLYNIVYDWSTIPVFVAAGDKVKVNSVGNLAKNYTIENSVESDLVRQFYQKYIAGIANLDKIALKYADGSTTEQQREEIAKEYSEEYRRVKREQLEFIITNKASLAAVYALYQRLPNDTYLFTGDSDVIYYRTVLEALQQSYPDSPYCKSLEADIANFDALSRITNNIEERGYPDLEISDVFGKKQKLSDLEGKVILLDFWSAQSGGNNRLNAELKELYAELKDKGLEIYQVAIDTSKATWINAVQEQGLPWISVSDLNGTRSIALPTYNVTSIPANFIISKDGDIVARDIYGDDLEAMLKAELAK